MGEYFRRPFFDHACPDITAFVQIDADVWRREFESDSGVFAAFDGGYAGFVIIPSCWVVGLGLVSSHRVVRNLGRLRLAVAVFHTITDPIGRCLQFFGDKFKLLSISIPFFVVHCGFLILAVGLRRQSHERPVG